MLHGHEGSPTTERAGPCDADKRRDREAAEEVVRSAQLSAGAGAKQLAGPSAEPQHVMAATPQIFAISFIWVLSESIRKREYL